MKSCPTLCNPMDCSTPGFPVLHYLPEFAQIRVHWVGDATQPYHSLLPSSPFASFFPSIKVFSNESPLTIRWPEDWSFRFSSSPPVNIQGSFPWGLTYLISSQSKELLRVFSSFIIWKHLFFSLSLLYGPPLTFVHYYWKNPNFDYTDFCWQSSISIL